MSQHMTDAPPLDEQKKSPRLSTSPAHTDELDTDILQLDPYGIPLSPSPTTDPLDPLNWSKSQKSLILFIACYSGFLSVYMTGTPIASFSLLEEQFNASYSMVNWTIAIPSLGLMIGPLLFSALGDRWGRRPILIGTCALTILATGCTTIRSIGLGGYMVTRLIQGIGAGPSIVGGLSIIRDISFEHERGFMIGLWVMGLDIGGTMGCLVGGFTALANQYWAGYHVIIAYGVLLILEVFFLPETLFPRDLILDRIRNEQSFADINRTKMIKPWNVIEIPGVAHPRPEQGIIRFCKMWSHPRLVLGVLPYVFCLYWWVLSFMTMVPAAYSSYQPEIQGLLFSGLIVGTIAAELLTSGRLSDMICSRLATANNNIRTPEMRLYLMYPGVVLASVGTIIWGLSIDRQWHWITGQVAFFLFSAGMQIGNCAVSTYIFDCYPEHITEIMTFYAVVLNFSAFVEPWFINYWVEAVGYTWCFVTQGLIVLLLGPIYMGLQRRPVIVGETDS
ncbi:hypothetical protein CBS147331_4504 [Penicillium roqueforti]|nr:hypothetical protein CBS147331_4504 [Penicillium roqueforti]